MSATLTVWDVQHGSASLLSLPNGGNIVIDLGVGNVTGSNETFSPLAALRANGARVDEVVITHPHRDHLDDIFNVDSLRPHILRRPRHLSEQEIRAGNQARDSAILDKYFEIDRRFTDPVAPLANPEAAHVNGGVDFAFFTALGCSRDNLNNHSIVTFASYAGTTFCVPGDNEAPSWHELLQNQAFRAWLKRTTVFLAAHHGRDAGYCQDIFGSDLCQPSLVLVSDGPALDTSAVSNYCQHAKGWPVHSRSSGKKESRQVVTTRCDGIIQIRAYSQNGGNYLYASIE